jgi:hypothetical protein
MKRLVLAFVALLTALALVGCGSGGSGDEASTGGTAAAAPSPAVSNRQAHEVEKVCTQMAAEAQRLGRKVLATTHSDEYESPLEFTTEALIAPAVPVIEARAAELRAIRGAAAEPQLSAFVNLFDPILSLLEDRLRAGRQGDSDAAHKLELQLIDLGQVQHALAEEAGLKGCEVDLVGSFSQSPG